MNANHLKVLHAQQLRQCAGTRPSACWRVNRYRSVHSRSVLESGKPDEWEKVAPNMERQAASGSSSRWSVEKSQTRRHLNEDGHLRLTCRQREGLVIMQSCVIRNCFLITPSVQGGILPLGWLAIRVFRRRFRIRCNNRGVKYGHACPYTRRVSGWCSDPFCITFKCKPSAVWEHPTDLLPVGCFPLPIHSH